jgi:hypothetical protein
MKNNIAYCGLNCEDYDAYKATINNDEALRIKTAEAWSTLNGVPITPDMINCEGCRNDGCKTPFCQSLCHIRKCAQGKSYKTCGDCKELESCSKVKMVIANNQME